MKRAYFMADRHRVLHVQLCMRVINRRETRFSRHSSRLTRVRLWADIALQTLW